MYLKAVPLQAFLIYVFEGKEGKSRDTKKGVVEEQYKCRAARQSRCCTLDDESSVAKSDVSLCSNSSTRGTWNPM